MNEKKSIDKLFKEQLKDFDVAPKDHVWKNIEQKLHEDKRKKRRIIPIWWKFAGIAAGLVLLFTVANQIFNTSKKEGVLKEIIVNDSNTDNNKSQDENNTNRLKQNDASKVILENDTAEQVVDANSKTSIEGKEDTSIHKNKSNIIISENTINPIIASENSNRKKLKEKTENNIPTNTNDYKELLKENNNPLTKGAVASNTKTASKTQQNSQNTIENKSEIDKLTKSAKSNTNTTIAEVNTKDKNAVVSNAKTTSKSNQNTQNTIKDQLEIDELLKSTKTKSSVAIVNSKDKEVLEKNNSDIENDSTKDTKNKEEEKEEDTNAIEDAITKAEDTEEKEEEEEQLKRWSVSPSVAPIYFSSLGDGSPLDNQFVENTKEHEINMSYGINGSYAVNKKFKIRAGINKVQLGYKTNDVLIFENTNTVASANRQIANINLTDSMSQHSIYSARNFKFENAPATLFTKEQGSLDQQLGFIEVPIEIEYAVIESKIGLNLIGGFSSLFLSENDVYAVLNNGNRSRLGEASNVKDLSYTANLGISIDYNFSKQFQFNLEPTFKYQINTFNNTSGNFKPFFIGVYTGLSFKF